MTINEAMKMEKGTEVRFGTHPQVWTFFHYSPKRNDFAFTRPSGLFMKPIVVEPHQMKNVHKVAA